ncbi:hypothetical protein [Cyclobacterium jeungdonense]|uniref:Uncharacterized protein n=1 Tax=Cyclobacterium jeungdonense TaxID=708087 RepID=A0ABT8C9T6_9BACT|nr:hypothetical protein [Cyclobacterium jeungdonense]MDN3689121.1 hypothetical protein [Cyclobacterium jeungdonense]
MKKEQDYLRDITEIRSLMERSSRFYSLSGSAGILAGSYALIGAFLAYWMFGFNPDQVTDAALLSEGIYPNLAKTLLIAVLVLALSVGSTVFLSYQKAYKRKEKAWSPTARRLVLQMALPLTAGGILLLIVLGKGMTGFLAPLSLIFYGLAIFNAGHAAFDELKPLGLLQIGLGLFCAHFIPYGLLCWAIGFGLLHILFGLYMHVTYEK